MNPEDTRLPPFIADMEGKTYTFQVRVTAFNFTEHHKTFTVTRVAKDHGRLPDNPVVDNVRFVCIMLFLCMLAYCYIYVCVTNYNTG